MSETPVVEQKDIRNYRPDGNGNHPGTKNYLSGGRNYHPDYNENSSDDNEFLSDINEILS
ncbi:hypothetical protein DRQ33_07385 [bacterium]|nr:MAG: hypothetical protein DRQ33_07385 [bacterium]